jgi:hypothetical protein
MPFCERSKEDPGNLETIRELYGSKDVGVTAVCGEDNWKVAGFSFRMQMIPTDDAC